MRMSLSRVAANTGFEAPLLQAATIESCGYVNNSPGLDIYLHSGDC